MRPAWCLHSFSRTTLSFSVMLLSSTGLPPFSSHEVFVPILVAHSLILLAGYVWPGRTEGFFEFPTNCLEASPSLHP